MKYLASYLLLALGGKASPSAKDITALLATVGIEAESARIESLLAQLKGKDINEVTTRVLWKGQHSNTLFSPLSGC
jgi:large subunit ribosomal protein LP2